MINFIKVTFDGARDVYLNKKKRIGVTNETLYVGEAATYTFDLGEPRNYHPPEHTLAVSGTSKSDPCVIHFDKE